LEAWSLSFFLVRRFSERRFVLAVGHGDFHVSSRGGGGYVPAVSFAFPGRATLTVAPRDFENYSFWVGDDPWSRSYSRRTDMPFATSFVPGQEFAMLVRLVVQNDSLVAKSNGS
jgi:hypothetical protein